MADFTIPLTVPDAKVSELVAALNWKWRGPTGGPDMTPAELRAETKRRVELMLRNIYREHREWLAEQAADTNIDIT